VETAHRSQNKMLVPLLYFIDFIQYCLRMFEFFISFPFRESPKFFVRYYFKVLGLIHQENNVETAQSGADLEQGSVSERDVKNP